jgi:predicted metal-binding protein
MKSLIERETGPLTNLYTDKTFISSYQKSFTRARKRLHEIVHKVESAAFDKGYTFATGFIAGSCRLCAECVTPDSVEPCRYPFQARPSMEAMGIDVTQTAVNAGMPFDTPPKERVVFNGLILVG